ncbi:hypothetical protein GCM10016455_05530 [Aliiroseovarius zhejiangensis]|uniref:Gp5/Type VI secretion system Vgr protein OB-fold domain-containing protein n=1 Tax=Aliiroseovarius zhejiangensis TaxID=1632025 RepID=A0ABQ3IQH4_9RHOB|nr:phage baseplate assembly protein [Aliiroseovarius zhejiangensis]GHE88289.1 hypothetical protein GCM10016455_05530 [Aliiroseovarius zhejiangensis]
MSDFALSEIMRRIERMVVVATVVEADGDKVKVEWAGGVTSDWLKVAQLGSQDQKFWIPKTPGTQVVVISPGGDTTKGIVFPGPFAGGVPAGNFDGTFTGTGDVVADGISLVTHTHGDTMPGTGSTGQPQ